MYYDLWNIDSANIVESFDSEAEALAAVREMVEAYGEESIADWSLIPREGSDYGETIAHGRDLLDRARQTMPA